MGINKKILTIDPKNCSQCMSCMLICSFIHTNTFNPSRSFVKIKPSYHIDNEWQPIQIEFLEGCSENCRACANFCAYGALKIKRED